MAKARAVSHLEEVYFHCTKVRSITLSEALRLPAAEFEHAFCTLVWPVELMASRIRVSEAKLIVSKLLSMAQESVASGERIVHELDDTSM